MFETRTESVLSSLGSRNFAMPKSPC
jgi:hypothetical protein